MEKLLTLICCLFLLTEINYAQQTNEKVPVIINEIPANQKGKESAIAFSELEGLSGKSAPVFKAANMNGEQFDSEKLRGSIIVVNLWATFCAPCIAEMPKLNALVEKYKNKQVVFLAPAVDGRETLTAFLKNHSFSYQVLPAAFDVISQFSPRKKAAAETTSDSFEMVLPTHLVLDKNGIVVKHFWGFSKTIEAEISNTVDELLNSKTP